jgi:hypothetical protein
VAFLTQHGAMNDNSANRWFNIGNLLYPVSIYTAVITKKIYKHTKFMILNLPVAFFVTNI